MAKFITFDRPRPSLSGKTRVWHVRDRNRFKIGIVAWFGRWRRYAFFPSGASVFEQSCLRKLADFCEAKTRAHRKSKCSRSNKL